MEAIVLAVSHLEDHSGCFAVLTLLSAVAIKMDVDEILVEDDILEEENVIKDIRDFSALEKSDKTLSAIDHCDFFLETHCEKVMTFSLSIAGPGCVHPTV